jgi:hypothetical protein
MKNSLTKRNLCRLIVLCVGLFALAVLATARTPTAAVTTAVSLVNNSSREIRNVYLSHVNVDDWGANQLSEGTTIAPGQSVNLSNLACDQEQVKMIGEDQDGCFISTVVSCGSSSTWTVTNDSARDCGN